MTNDLDGPLPFQFKIMQNYNAIVFFSPEKKEKVRKYRNISNLPAFLIFIRKVDPWYINLYCSKTNQFFKRIYIQ